SSTMVKACRWRSEFVVLNAIFGNQRVDVAVVRDATGLPGQGDFYQLDVVAVGLRAQEGRLRDLHRALVQYTARVGPRRVKGRREAAGDEARCSDLVPG